jgi:tetratricopeptide (TPR) repeat protein
MSTPSWLHRLSRLLLLLPLLVICHKHVMRSTLTMTGKTDFRPNRLGALLLTVISITTSPIPAIAEPSNPSKEDIILIQQAYSDFDARKLDLADDEFSRGLAIWRKLDRPRDEIVSLLKARGSVRLDGKDFNNAMADYDEALKLMSSDGEQEDGTARYPEYPDTYVNRALVKEGLADWQGALSDYDKAVSLWGGNKANTGPGIGVNPFVLTFRGNTLMKLNRYDAAIRDYEAAADKFSADRNIARYSDARANQALALYQTGRRNEAVKYMKDVIRKTPGYADMHVALAADSWSRGDYISALKEWNFACNEISVGCSAYSDTEWLATVRRWPPVMVENLGKFLKRELPEIVKGSPGGVLAPSSTVVP